MAGKGTGSGGARKHAAKKKAKAPAKKKHAGKKKR
jgi:hypothetical protein